MTEPKPKLIYARFAEAIRRHWTNTRLNKRRVQLVSEKMFLRAYPHWMDPTALVIETERVNRELRELR